MANYEVNFRALVGRIESAEDGRHINIELGTYIALVAIVERLEALVAAVEALAPEQQEEVSNG